MNTMLDEISDSSTDWNSPEIRQKMKERILKIRDGRVSACFSSVEAKRRKKKGKDDPLTDLLLGEDYDALS